MFLSDNNNPFKKRIYTISVNIDSAIKYRQYRWREGLTMNKTIKILFMLDCYTEAISFNVEPHHATEISNLAIYLHNTCERLEHNSGYYRINQQLHVLASTMICYSQSRFSPIQVLNPDDTRPRY